MVSEHKIGTLWTLGIKHSKLKITVNWKNDKQTLVLYTQKYETIASTKQNNNHGRST